MVGRVAEIEKLGWSRLRATKLLLAAGGLLALVIAAAGVVLLRDTRASAMADAARRLSGLSMVLADQADGALAAIDLMQNSLQAQITDQAITSESAFAAHMASRAVHDSLRERISGLPQMATLAVVNSQGRIIVTSYAWPTPVVDLGDRDYFQAVSGSAAAARAIGRPVRNRSDGSWTIILARRVTAADGGFLGAIVAAVNLDYFSALYRRVGPDQADVFSLFDREGVLIARYPPLPEMIGRGSNEAGVPAMVAAGASGVVLRSTSPLDQTERLVVAQTLDHYPMVLGVGRSLSATLAPWARLARVLVGAIVLLECGVAGVVLLGLRQLRDQARLATAQAARREAEAIAQGERALRAQYASFGAALDSMTQGLCMFDAAQLLVASNRRLVWMVGLARPPQPGTSLAGCLAAIATAGALEGSEIRRAAAALRRLMTARAPASQTWHLADGRAMAVQFQPTIDGGWVLTCEDVTEQGRAAARIAFLAHHDPLTRLPNRALFAERLEQAVREADHGAGCAVLYLDLDHFKRINDTQGHAAGDRLLEQVAARLRRCVRDSDTVSRLGGDEFAVIQTGLEQPAIAGTLASRIIAEIGLPYEIDGQQVIIETSIGIAFAPEDGSDGTALLQHADIALYSAKAAGRGCFRFFEPAMDARLEAARHLDMELRRALPNGEFELFYQPLLQTGSLAILGFEALLRWRHPARGLLSADAFVPAMEESGMIVAVGEWVLARACREAAGWPAGLKIAVNLSALQFQGTALVPMVRAALEAAGLAPRRLELEITETVLLRDSSETLATLQALRGLGVAIALDDFGAGYSSLSYLHRFPFDKVKIDRGFVQGLGNNREATAIVRAVSGLCRDLAVATLAEGVETEAQLAALRAEGCTEVQGYLFSPARPASEVAGLLERFGAVRETI